MDHLINLNDEQHDIVNTFVNTDISSVCIVAGAGVGKTKTIVAGIINMIKIHRRNPEYFLITTFTRNAAAELKERLLEHLTETQVSKMTIGTFHSVAISFFAEADESYIDDDIESYLHMLKEFVTINKTKWRYVFIDEYQDINEVQEDIIYQLSQRAKMTVVVGDDQQNIYTFRKTNIKYILNFTEKYTTETKKSIRKYLVKNYRCNRCFIGLANMILSYNVNKLDKELIAMRPDQDNKVTLMSCVDQKNQIKDIVELIIKAHNKSKPLHKMAIISRTNGTIKTLEQQLTEFGIPSFYIEPSSDNIFTQTSIQSIENRVILSTMHGTKGLEFDNVYIVDCNDGTFPSSMSTDIEEERRLFYVATTRAMKKLTICYDGHKPSIFINEILKHENCDQFVCQRSQFDREPLVFMPKKNYPIIKDFSVENIITKLEYYDYEDFCSNIMDYKETEPTIERLHRPMTNTFGTYTHRELLVANTSKLFKNFIETYISRTIQHKCSLPIENIDYVMYAFKWCKESIEMIKSGENINMIDGLFNLNLKSKTKEQLDEYINYYQSGMRIFDQYDKTFKDKFVSSYGRYTSALPSNQIIFDIFVISLIKTLLFDGRSSIMHVINFNRTFEDRLINKGDIYEYKRWFKFVETALGEYFEEIDDVKISGTTFDTDTDIKSIINIKYDDSIMIVRPTTNIKPHVSSLIQVLGDASLERRNGHEINHCIIYNPITGLMHSWDISSWANHDDLIFYLTERFS